MCKTGKTIYYLSRLEANGISREEAAYQLGISTESLGAYERGETRTPCDLVIKMANLYDDPILTYRHMTECCAVGKECLPRFEHREAPTAVLHLQKEMADVSDLSRDMVTAACQGTVTALGNATKEVTEMVGAGMAYLFSGRTKKRTASVASTSGSVRARPL